MYVAINPQNKHQGRKKKKGLPLRKSDAFRNISTRSRSGVIPTQWLRRYDRRRRMLQGVRSNHHHHPSKYLSAMAHPTPPVPPAFQVRRLPGIVVVCRSCLGHQISNNYSSYLLTMLVDNDITDYLPPPPPPPPPVLVLPITLN